MPPKLSAGLLLYRRGNQDDDLLEVLLAHMGGPFWARKDDGAWSIPKGEYEPGEDPFMAAKREFEEELGSAPPPLAVYRELGSVIQPSGKVVTAWAAEADFDAAGAVSNTFELEWPRGSGRLRSFPEIDRASWFTAQVARVKLVKGQRPLIDRLLQLPLWEERRRS